MVDALPRSVGRRWPWLLSALALLVFAATSTLLPVPEESATYLVDYLRLTPFPPMDRPLWGGLLRALAHGFPGHEVAVANGLSVLFGALGVGLLSRLVARSAGRDRWNQLAPALAPVAGLAAGLALATCIPFWLVSNRAHPATLGLLLLLLALTFFQNYRLTGRRSGLYAGTLVYAVGLVELPTMLIFAPVVALHLLVMMWQQRHLSIRTLLLLSTLLLAAPAIWLLAAADYAHQPAARWREMDGFGEAMRYSLLNYREVMLRSVPKQGWLILLFTSLLPWLLAYAAIRHTAAWAAGRGAILLHGLITLLVIAILWNAPLTPWTMLGTQPLLVTPYVLVAAAFGLLLLRWGLLIVQRIERTNRSAVSWVPFLVAVVAVVVTVVAGFRNGSQVSTRAAGPVHQLASAMVDHLQGRDFVVSSGGFDEHLLLELRARRSPHILMNLASSERSGYRRYLASLFQNPHQQSLALAGLAPVLVEWLAHGTGGVERLALQVAPDLWISEGCEPLPMGSVYLGARGLKSNEVDLVRSTSQAFWPNARTWLQDWQRTAPRMKPQAKMVAAHLARIANDTGVFFEHAGLPSDAREAYAQARQLDPENLSAAANLLVLGQASGWTGFDMEEAELALAVAPRDQPYVLVASRYGHLRRREAAQMVGSVGLGDEVPVAADPQWTASVSAYLNGERAEARRRVEKLLATRPEFDPAWILLATLAYEQGDEVTLQKCVRQMRLVRREWPELAVLLGRAALDRQDLARARDYFERAAQLRPQDFFVLELLLKLDLREQDYRRAEVRIRRILSLRPSSVAGQIGLATLLRYQDRNALAEATLLRVLELQRHPAALAELAALYVETGRVLEATPLAEEAVLLGPRVVASHEAMGLVHEQAGALDLAQDAYIRALTLDGRSIGARLYLAALLMKNGNPEEATTWARALRKEKRALSERQQRVLDALPL